MSDATWYKLVLPSGVLSTASKLDAIQQSASLAVTSREASVRDAVFYREDLEVTEVYFTSGFARVASSFDAMPCDRPVPDQRRMHPLNQFIFDALSVHLPDHARG